MNIHTTYYHLFLY